MSYTIFKIIAPITQADVKIGLPKELGIKSAILPETVLKVIAPPPPSAKQEYLISQGKGDEVSKALRSYGYMRFESKRSSELGFIDPNYKNEPMKIFTLIYNTEEQTPEDFAEVVNFFRALVAKRSDGIVFEISAKCIVYDNAKPVLLSRDITAEDVDPERAKKKGVYNFNKKKGEVE